METVLKGKKWNEHLKKYKLEKKSQLELYRLTYNYQAIYFLEGYYFVFGILRGYKNLASLKRLL